jgi:hypothetical protein
LIGDDAEIPNCPRCGRSVTIERSSAQQIVALDQPTAAGAVDDDSIVSWLAGAASSPPARSDGDAECPACGYQGLMAFDPERADLICPACLEDYPTKPAPARAEHRCPHCGRAIEIGEEHRGRTIICSGCKYFLGCLLPTEKRKHWQMGAGPWARPRRPIP